MEVEGQRTPNINAVDICLKVLQHNGASVPCRGSLVQFLMWPERAVGNGTLLPETIDCLFQASSWPWCANNVSWCKADSHDLIDCTQEQSCCGQQWRGMSLTVQLHLSVCGIGGKWHIRDLLKSLLDVHPNVRLGVTVIAEHYIAIAIDTQYFIQYIGSYWYEEESVEILWPTEPNIGSIACHE